MRRALPYVLCIAVLAASGCSKNVVRLESRHRFYQRILSLSPSCAEIICGNADTNNLIGRTSADDYPDAMLKQVPIVSGVTPDYEQIAAAKPDFIMCDASLYSKQEIDKIKATNPSATVYVVDCDTLDDYIKQMFELGALLANEMRFNDYVNRILAAKTESMSTKLPSTPKVAVILPSADGNDYIEGTDSFVADIVRIDGGTPVGPKGNLFVKMDPEMLVSLNPDVIICSGTKKDMTGAEAMIKDPRLQTITAIKKAGTNIGAIDPEVLERRGERVDSLIKNVREIITAGVNGK